MIKRIMKIKRSFDRLRKSSVEYSVEAYKPVLEEINKLKFDSLGNQQLKTLSNQLMERVRNGHELDGLLVESYGLVREASRRVLGMRPFDVQVIAAIAMHQGKLAEIQTGEGKTLAAVLPAYLNALSGKGVHILTFNDYLAKRDAEWMGPVFNFLGMSVGYIQEGMDKEERNKAYAADITYLTAKEAGFDYLREFLCVHKEQLVQRPYNYAIVDEADSILIDEARIPLVIAGKDDENEVSPSRIVQVVKALIEGEHYDRDEYGRNVYLTNKGVDHVEEILKCGNLYDEKNLVLLSEISNVLHAEALLKRDVDYVVRDGRIELVDEFTGRIADKRHWPDGLQAAIEAKEGIRAETKGRIMGSITLQNFIKLYPRICGMTGTAFSSADEFEEFYGLKVVVIPTNRLCARIDHPDVIFTHKDAKFKALISEIIQVHKTGRPVLIGTCSVEESERLAKALVNEAIGCQVLNAKNDKKEAEIIARAGELGAVTVSTNMAGRGTDIRLGGRDGQECEKVRELGGLYVIGTNRHESLRIDNQLRGRAGRQGDPGSTRFFISLEDDLMVKYRIDELIPKALYPEKSELPVENKFIRNKIASAQRIIEGQNFEVRRNLSRYSYIIEQQRLIIHKRRMAVLLDRPENSIFMEKLGTRYSRLLPVVGEGVLKEVEKRVTLYFINRCWTDYLDYVSYIRESIHLVNIKGSNPLDEFIGKAVSAFDEMLLEIDNGIVEALSRVEIREGGIDMEKEGFKNPSSTWTYMVDDGAEQLGILAVCANPMTYVMIITIPLAVVLAVYNRFFKKRRELK
jgi:preprotein translocase subunit SecA